MTLNVRKKKEKIEKTVEPRSYSKQLLTIAKASLFAVLLTVVLFLVTALVLWLCEIDDDAVPIIVQVIRVISIALAGIICGKRADKMGWLSGMIAGLLYVIVTAAIGMIFFDGFKFDSMLVSDALLGIGTGFVAGIIGINLRKR